MGVRFRKSAKLPGGGRVNFSKSGIGGSVGTKGFRVTKMASGSTRTTTSIPGSGVSYVRQTSGNASTQKSGPSLYNIVLSASLIVIVICSMILLFTSCSSGKRHHGSVPTSTPEQSTQPANSEARQAGEDYLAGLGYEVVATKSASASLEFSVALPNLSLQFLETPPDDWDEIYSAALDTANGLLDELGDQVQYVVLRLQDSSGHTLVSFLNGVESYNSFAPKEDSSTTTADDNTIVWIVDGGSRYHRNPDCSNMDDASPVRLSYAKEHGYTACSKCAK